ncbi:ornithine carbamoyltransferase [Haliovirga abyssi]|uniref:Ornithine carbamoyltransferase n=1 Tax=Haliovirga abyssi TaxID=2996794 RepID=A0AAU9DFR1_9FUSO|nr:ornithine carbamoyltransferase [Haliovirga abyssi]BDU51272.1 ornithine carbamoyltransferase [Haliovirga abyssi]
MAVSLKGRHFLKLEDFTKEELIQILDTADFIKMRHKIGIREEMLKGKTLAMIFEKSSTRTRVSFEVGMAQLGGEALHLSSRDIQIGRGETIADTSRVLSRYVDGIMIRTYGQEIVEEMAKYSDVPVINALTDEFHPCQIMADFQTMREKFHKLEGLKIAYIGDAANVANSLLIGSSIMGIDISLACPKGYQPTDEILATANKFAKKSGAKIVITDNIEEAVKGSDALYTDIWVSMGKEEEMKKRFEDLKDYQINSKVLGMAKENAIVMHCLPAHRGEEITDEVLEGAQSVVFDEAENRLHAQKAIMALIMG